MEDKSLNEFIFANRAKPFSVHDSNVCTHNSNLVKFFLQDSLKRNERKSAKKTTRIILQIQFLCELIRRKIIWRNWRFLCEAIISYRLTRWKGVIFCTILKHTSYLSRAPQAVPVEKICHVEKFFSPAYLFLLIDLSLCEHHKINNM